MITCSVCGKENDDLSIVCSSCKSYLQGKVDALDLFQTIWGLAESPGKTFKRIVLAKHKNYTLLLAFVFGIRLVLDIAWYKSIGDRVPSLITITGAAFVLGPLAGCILLFVGSLLLQSMTKLMGGKATRRNLFAAIAYAAVPAALSLVFLFPIEVAVFGIDFFGKNPPPSVIKPLEYSILLGLKGLAAVWGAALLIRATMAANAFTGKKYIPVTLSVIGLLAAFVALVHFVNI